MSTAYAKYTGLGGGSNSGVVTIYNNVAAFPVSTTTGDLAVDASTGNLYEFNGAAWVQIAGPGAAISLGNLDSETTSNKGANLVGGVLAMQSATASFPGLVNISSQTFAGIKTFSSSVLHADGTNSLPAVSFALDPASGMYKLGTSDIGFAAGTYLGLEIKKSAGAFANVGMGAAASSSDNYPLLIQRSSVSSGTYAQISNPDTSASSKATYQLAADLGANTGEISLFTAATATDAYSGAMTVRPSDGTKKLSLIGGDLAAGYVTTYTGGDYASTGETTRFNADHTNQFMQSVTAPTSPAAGLKFYNNAGVFSSKTTGGVVSSFSGSNTGDVTIGTASGLSLSNQALSLGLASAGVTGALSGTDWSTFNNKGSGTVTAVSVASANGFAGSSSGGATPALTLTTSITGVLKGNGTAISAATSGTDYSAGTSGLSTGILKSTTTTGALTIAVAADFPTLNQNTTGTALNITASSNSTLTTLSSLSLPATQLSGTLAAGQFPALTGDITTSAGALGTTLATVNSNVGSFTNANITINGKGLITAASNGTSSFTPLQPNVQIFLSGSVTYGVSYYFTVTSASATAAATYTNNGQTFTVVRTISSGTSLLMTSTGAPAASGTLTKASGTGDSTITFSVAQAPLYIEVEAIGAGGGGGGSGSSSTGGTGGTGGSTTFGSSLVTCTGGVGGQGPSTGSNAGSGALAPTINSPAITVVSMAGGAGYSVSYDGVANAGGIGAASPYGGSGGGGASGVATTGGAAAVNSGAGGGGGAGGATMKGGAGAGSGAFARFMIINPSATYAVVIGAGGTVGTSGTSGFTGGLGGSGRVHVVEKWQ